MPIVIEDLERGNRILFDLTTVTVQRIFRVSALVEAPELQLMEALGQAQIPQYVDLYPLPPDPSPSPDPWADYRNIAVIDRQARPDGPAAALITVTYTNDFGLSPALPPGQNDSADIKQVRFAIGERTTTKDRNGSPMLIAPPAGYSTFPDSLSEAQSRIPLGSVSFERTEGSAPDGRMRSYVGKLNQSSVGAYPPQTLLCSSIDASSNDDIQWRVTYEFDYDEDGWKHVDRFRDPLGRIPAAAEEVEFDVGALADFNALGLSF